MRLTTFEEKFLLLFVYSFNLNENFRVPDEKDFRKLLNECFQIIAAEEDLFDKIGNWAIYKIKTILDYKFFLNTTILLEVEKKILEIINDAIIGFQYTSKLENYNSLMRKNKALANKKIVLQFIQKDLKKFVNLENFILDALWLENSKKEITKLLKNVQLKINHLVEKEKEFSK